MNLRDLEYLVAVGELKHFRKAAEKCFVSQPTLSGQLKKLESYLGGQLIERTTRKVFLTPIGEEIVKIARTILADVASIENMVATYSDPMCGTINIGLIPTIAPYLLPLIVQPINEAYPQIEIILHEVQTDVMLEKLSEGTLDAGILAVPIEMKGLDEITLYTEPFYVAANNQHMFASKLSIKIEDLRDETLLLLEEGHCLRGQVMDVCSQTMTKERKDFQGTSLETIRHMVSTGIGITLIPQTAIDYKNLIQNASIKYIPFKKPAPARRVGLLFRKTSNRKVCFEKLAASIQSIIQREFPIEEDVEVLPVKIKR
ncbi:MAG: DNA-binding transcriptional regulator OxyR [Proteobacteria bacterium]|jgi:LysR family transcriptional regulator, hydrogen peroxide-inducible genes activator|nr:DNA-binding transcriptional regulator OxyR [Pseudomonadota bacterium]MBT5793956.1 DNA-binding transcriptional regulator OxyR [Deltaproteobacteria bacterium]MDB3916907.1 DNA-binding transcriptional regulator OxyR [bacterium]